MAGVSGPMMRRRPADGARFLAASPRAGSCPGCSWHCCCTWRDAGCTRRCPRHRGRSPWRPWRSGSGSPTSPGRTPHAWRQVPQVLVHRLRPGFLGVVWGFDLGLLVTTQKAASLVWAGVAAVVLLDPRAAAPVMVGLALLSNLSVALASVRFTPALIDMGTRRERLWLRSVRALSGTALVTLAAVTAVQAL
ncbi:hypothetical protein [Actinomadura madurae]|uniref:hypothetical protein n=1 Tax=Actinomadura madurae TaxID=1993 RepID=UPI0020D21839|nr:hypothetical protein [Actinomadura madurae]MCP9954256.1 hypothetical protein [Actinomadura madurae]MCQ0004944.1 hypothetical protein [Actinomadura madurae]